MSTPVQERLSFHTLYGLSEPRRKVRAQTVSGPPLKLDTFTDQMMWSFNFKSAPSTTGLRHHGYIRFFKPRRPKQLQQLECIVDCTCQDFKYRWAWANKQRGSSQVGPRSMNHAWNQAPRITNPTGRPGLCKHLLALKDYIYGVYAGFPTRDREFTDDAMKKLVRYAQNRWINLPDELERARARDQRAASVRAARNRGQVEPGPLVTTDQDAPGSELATAGGDQSIPATDAPNAATPLVVQPPPVAPTTPPPRRMRFSRQQQPPATGTRQPPRAPRPQEGLVLMNGMNKTKRLSETLRADLTGTLKLVELCAASPEVTPMAPVAPAGAAVSDGSEDAEAISLLRAVADNTAQLADLLRQLMPAEGGEAGLDQDLDGDGAVKDDDGAAADDIDGNGIGDDHEGADRLPAEYA